MSGIAGIFNLDGAPVERELLDRLMLLLAPWGPDGTSGWSRNEVALGYGALNTTPESWSEAQPVSHEGAGLHLVFDGRIDNREELLRELEGKEAAPAATTDADIALRAYAAWGASCALRLLGDFAFVVWDAPAKRLYCARDVLGCRPFYYHAGPRQFVFGSEVAHVLAAPGVDQAPNEGVIAEFLAAEVTTRDETLYSGVRRLPPAHYLVVTSSGVTCRRYWDIDLDRQLRFQDGREYIDCFFSLFEEAVRCRMRSAGSVAAELSGGLDSSSVVGMVQHLFREGSVPERGFEIFSWRFPGLSCDESDFIDAVARKWRLQENTVSPTVEPAQFASQVQESRYVTTDAIGLYADRRKEAAHERGFKVLLTGLGGDDWLAGADNPYPDLIGGFRWRDVVSELRTNADDLGLSATTRLLLVSAAAATPVLRAAHAALAARRRAYPWLRPEFAARTALRDRCDRMWGGRTFPSHALRERFWFLANGWLPLGCENDSWSAARYSLELRHPLFDRRIVEFAFAVPEDWRRRNGERKYVLRQAMRSLLPAAVFHRRTKVDFSCKIWELLDSLGGAAPFAQMRIADRGYVDGRRLLDMVSAGLVEHRKGGQPSYVWVAWLAHAIETWLRFC